MCWGCFTRQYVVLAVIFAQDALHLHAGTPTPEHAPRLDLTSAADPLSFSKILLQEHRAGYLGPAPPLLGNYTLLQHSSQAEVRYQF